VQDKEARGRQLADDHKRTHPTIITRRWERKRRDAKGKDFVLRKVALLMALKVDMRVETTDEHR
jgi:hypothetical protein